ncbi:AraC family transcriptional regulator [Thioclava dalianensis]|uniref:AraC family transcriptional regulator n=1 Tax=Thioclava dalianensis TaxID=1185766 RepID=A0A074TGF4_9RHOB|nr:AraC family transcriptional regulator [Thioclava dalianensis]KEP70766.1 AraC family transcriptional regulator [Thioclava dalianensis]
MQQSPFVRLTRQAEALSADQEAIARIDGLRVTRRTAPTGPFHGRYRPSLCVVLRGAKVSRLGNRSFCYSAGKCLIASLEVPIIAEVVEASPEAPYLAFSLTLDPVTISDLLVEHDNAAPPLHADTPALSVEALPEALIDPLERLLALPARPNDLPVLEPMIRREITWLLLNGPHGAMLRQIGLAESRMARIARAVTWIRANFAQSLNVGELATLAGMSPTTFHRHFKAATALTPVQFQKQLRLQEARRLLLSEGSDVARVGFEIGYDSPSQFSREYRRLFGAPPGRDSAQLRRDMTAATSEL